MPAPKTKANIEKELIKEVKSLAVEVKKIKSLEFMKVFKHPMKFLWFSFLKGLMVGFGSVLGASVLVGIFVYLVAQISVVPIIGDVVKDVIGQVEGPQTQSEEIYTNGDETFFEQYDETK